MDDIKKDDFYQKTKHVNTLFQFIKNNKEEQFIEYISALKPDEVDVNMKDEQGNYLIYFSILTNNKRAVQKLIEYGSRLDILDNEGHSILYYPIKLHYPEIIDALVQLDKKAIGLSLINIKDSKGNIPIFYSIRFKNHYALQELLANGADPNYKNNENLNALHIAVLKKDASMVRTVVKYIKNIDTKSVTGDTALHYACNYQLTEIVKVLLEFNADPNIVEGENDFTPIFFSVIQNNFDITKLLIEAGANPNQQDSQGNTIVHYSIIYNHLSILDMIFNKYIINENKQLLYIESINQPDTTDEHHLDPDIINIDGLTIMHMMLYSYQENFDPYISKILPYININYQDNTGNTVLHVLVEKKVWSKFNTLLENKKLSIYIKNNNGKTILDMIPMIERENFIGLVIIAYFNYLKRNHRDWLIQWQNTCSKIPIEQIDNSICHKLIRDSIVKEKISVPEKKTKKFVSVEHNDVVQFSTFTGSALDTISGFKYLTNKYSNTTSLYAFIQNDTQELERYYQSIGIQIGNYQRVIQFEILWVYQRLFFPSNFESMISSIIKSKRYEYIIIPIGITLSAGSHSGSLIYHINDFILERFEPHGSHYPYRFNYNPKILDELIYKKFSHALNNIYGYLIKLKYYQPINYLPKIGFQMFENIEVGNKNIGDPNGYCTLWCIWYLDYRLRYLDINPKKLVKNLITQIKINNYSFKNIIRNYSKKITDLRDTYLAFVGKNVNDYMNEKLTTEEITRMVNFIVEQ
jgi:ankyrin repeat protein